MVGFYIAYGLSALLSHRISHPGAGYVNIWIPAGLFVAVLLQNETRRWPWFVLAVLGATLSLGLPHGTPLPAILRNFTASCVGALSGAWLMRRFVTEWPRIATLKEFLGLVFCCGVVGMALCTSVAVTPAIPWYTDAWKIWWGSDAMAVVLVTPLILTWRGEVRHSWRWLVERRARIVEVLALVTGLLGYTWYMLVIDQGIMTPYKIRLVLFVLWAALRFGVRGVTAVNALLAIFMSAVVAFVPKGLTAEQIAAGEHVFTLQTYLALMALAGLITAIVLGERDRMVAQLRESEARYRNLTAAAFEGVVIIEQGRIVDISEQGLRLYGYTRAEMIGLEAATLVTPDDRERVVNAIGTGREAAYEARLLRKDGSEFFAEIQARMVHLPDRTVRMTAVRDVTERRRMQRALEASEAQLRAVLDHLPAAAYTCDAQGLITYFNRQAERAWGRAPKLNDPADRYSGSGRIFSASGEPIPNERSWMALALREQRPVLGEKIFIERPDGTRCTGLAHASPIFDAAGALTGAVNVVVDISDLTNAREALAASEMLLRQFIKYAPAAVAMFDTEMRYVQASDRWLTDYGLKGVNLIGRSHYEVFPDMSEQWKQIHRRVLAGAIESRDEDSFFRSDGTLDWLQWEVRPWHRADGTVGGVIMFTQVITARKRAAAELGRANRALRTISLCNQALARAATEEEMLREVCEAIVKVGGHRFAWVGHALPDERQTIRPTVHAGPDGRLLDTAFISWGDNPHGQGPMGTAIRTGRATICRDILSDPAYAPWRAMAMETGTRSLLGLPLTSNGAVLGGLAIYSEDTDAFDLTEVKLLTELANNLANGIQALRERSERQETQEALRDNRAKLVLAMDMAGLGHWEFDVSAGRFIFDDNFLKLLGTTAAREGGSTMLAQDYARRFVHPEEAGLVASEIEVALAATDPNFTRQLEHRFIRADGSPGVMSVRFGLVKDAAGRTVRTFGVNQDVTKQRQVEHQRRSLEEQLRQTQKMEALGTLAGGIAHDFNNILTGIMGNLQLAEMDIAADNPVQTTLREAGKASRRARDLVARILTFSRRSQADRVASPLGPIVHEVLQLLRASLPATIEIRTAIAADCPAVLCDVAQIHQVIMNLGTNAAHAMRERGGTLMVELHAATPSREFLETHPQVNSSHNVCLTIRDTGCGMDEVVRKRIFEPFFTTKGPNEGTGLGLAMVHGIMQNHHGAIVVDSMPGEGTAFALYFAAAAGTRSAGDRRGSHTPFDLFAPFGDGRKILLVDDEEAVLVVGAMMLRRIGFEPVAFANPIAALAAFRDAPGEFAAAVSDLTMPGMTGLELARELRAARPDLPLMLASGYLPSEARAGASELDVGHVLQKPFELQEFVERLRSAIDGAKQEGL